MTEVHSGSSVMAAILSGRAVLWLQCILGEQCYGCNAFWESSVMAVSWHFRYSALCI